MTFALRAEDEEEEAAGAGVGVGAGAAAAAAAAAGEAPTGGGAFATTKWVQDIPGYDSVLFCIREKTRTDRFS